MCQVFESGIGNREDEERPTCEQQAVLLGVVPLIRQKSRLRFDQRVNAGITAAVNFGWYSNPVRADHSQDSGHGRPGLETVIDIGVHGDDFWLPSRFLQISRLSLTMRGK